jgi:hypothetical protein
MTISCTGLGFLSVATAWEAHYRNGQGHPRGAASGRRPVPVPLGENAQPDLTRRERIERTTDVHGYQQAIALSNDYFAARGRS